MDMKFLKLRGLPCQAIEGANGRCQGLVSLSSLAMVFDIFTISFKEGWARLGILREIMEKHKNEGRLEA